ncbi:MAG: IS3 family transposase [Gemmataceae bacterium]
MEAGHPQLSVRRQCELLGLSRSSLYYEPAAESAENVLLMRLRDQEYTAHPFLGSRRLTKWLIEQGEEVNRKRVHQRTEHVGSTDITYIPLARGFTYLAAIIDWFSRSVLVWRLSNTLDGSFCLDMLEEALSRGRPQVFNTEQGVQFTAAAWTGRLESAGVAVSMDGKGRCLDKLFVERLWRTVKYEEVYLHRYEVVPQLVSGLKLYFAYYNEGRLPQSLDYRTLAIVYQEGKRSA